MVSVIIPVYKAEHTIEKCVESILLGIEQNVEVILIEDRSPDKSWVKCCDLQKRFPSLRIYQNSRNSGVSYTRNRGLSEAQGKYVLFVDSDDWVSGRYVHRMRELAEDFPSALPVCGYKFLDKVNGTSQDMLYQGEEEGSITEQEDLYRLSDYILIQQLWNKIFRLDLIQKHGLRFDETLSMGEDFQFVLDYLEKGNIGKCVVINQPLYYYIRYHNQSLMGEFGFSQNRAEESRAEQLHRISGLSDTTRRDAMMENSRRNAVYHIVRSPSHTKQEKQDAIEAVMADGQAAAHYREQSVLRCKENLVQSLAAVKALPGRIKGRMERKQHQKKLEDLRKTVKMGGVSVISQNCIGGVLCHDMGQQFLSPTVNTFIKEPDFVKLCLNLRHYMALEPVMQWGEEYPIGILDDVTVHFMHYETCTQARDAWNRRRQRIHYDKILVLATDRDGFDDAVYELWKQIPYPKLLFTANPNFTEDAVFFPEYVRQGYVSDLIGGGEFYRDDRLVERLKQL